MLTSLSRLDSLPTCNLSEKLLSSESTPAKYRRGMTSVATMLLTVVAVAAMRGLKMAAELTAPSEIRRESRTGIRLYIRLIISSTESTTSCVKREKLCRTTPTRTKKQTA